MTGITLAASSPTHSVTRREVQVPPSAREQGTKWAFVFLWCFTVAIYARPEDIFPPLGQVHLTMLLGFCAGMAYLAGLLSKRVPGLWPAELRLVLLLTAWYIAGLPFAYWKGGSFQILLQVWLKTLLIFGLLTQTLTTLERIRSILWAIILSELVVTSLSILQPSEAVWVGGRMAGYNQGILGWNFLGIAAGITLPYIGALFVLRRSLLKFGLLAAACFFMLWMVILTASRSGLLIVVFSLAVTTFMVLRDSSRGRMVSIAIVLALTVVMGMASKVFWERLGTIWGGADLQVNEVAASAQESTEDHWTVLYRSLEYTVDKPLFGLGLGNFQVANGTDLGRPSAWMGTHNTFTEISSEAGIPALFLFVAAMLTALNKMRKVGARFRQDEELRLLSRATLASLLVFIFSGFFAHLGYEYYCFYPLAISAGIYHVAQQGSPGSAAMEAGSVLRAVV